MIRVERAPGAVTLVSRLARPHVLVVLAGVLLAAAAGALRLSRPLAAALAAAAVLLAVLGGRAVRARFARGRVTVRPASPLEPRVERSLEEFAATRVETLGEARRRRADERARSYRARSGAELPDWLRTPVTPGSNDQLRRLVLVGRGGEPLPVTAWLAEDDLDAARAVVDALLHGG
jgi:hypothetical protein